ncbi:hypothetical protein CSIM01_11026 [Colletotrichum simmondsii]|uniref:Uncharacterized protein n=1 Tax=Colletotrichum simmondsii TaxID=703756 RepID=A0A135TXN7_9PEZI|nr:hypothetical protein CSIM01_11026 [Colletotrichum simmondsii]
MLKNRGEAAVKNGGNGTEDGINGATPTPRVTLGWDHERWISAIPQGFRMEPHFTAPTGVEKLEAWAEREREANEHPPSSARGSESTSHDAKTRSQSPDGEDR